MGLSEHEPVSLGTQPRQFQPFALGQGTLSVSFQQLIVPSHFCAGLVTAGYVPQRLVVEFVHGGEIRLKFCRHIVPGWGAAHS